MSIRIRSIYSQPLIDTIRNHTCGVLQYMHGNGRFHHVCVRIEIAPKQYAMLELHKVFTWGQGSFIELCGAVGMADTTRDFIYGQVPSNYDWVYQLNRTSHRVFKTATNANFCFSHNDCMRIIK